MLSRFDKPSQLLQLFSISHQQISDLFVAANEARAHSPGPLKMGAALLVRDSDKIFSGCASKLPGRTAGASALQNALGAALTAGAGDRLRACLITSENEKGARIKLPPSWEDRELLSEHGLSLVILACSPSDFTLKTSASLLPWPSPLSLSDKQSSKLWQAQPDLSPEEVLALANHWIAVDPCPNSVDAVQQLILSDDYPTLKGFFKSRISFGTAGLRAKMAPGYNAMNYVTVQQTAQGLAAWLQNKYGSSACKEKGVVIGYDARYHSEGFAHISAAVFAEHHIKVKLFQGCVATPMVPFAVKRDDCLLGVMVTASHNPKADNGYKVYAGNAAQIVQPVDQEIQLSILKHLPLQSLEQFFDYFHLRLRPGAIGYLSEDWTLAVQKDYQEMIQANLQFNARQLNQRVQEVTVYTAMHGVGFRFVAAALRAVGVQKLWVVPEQKDPDPQFPTVVYPNPEEGKGALKLAIRTAEKHSARLILANDPDADRLAVAEKVGTEWQVFTGDQIGAMLAQFLAGERKGSDKKLAFVASTVSSKLLREMGRKKDIHFEEVLTGFKWISNKAIDLQKQGFEVLLGYEEAIGFSVLNLVRDKDGLSAAVVMAQLAARQYEKGSSLSDYLQGIYKQYGYFATQNSYFICQDKETIGKIFEGIRADGHYCSHCGAFKIKSIRDLTKGYDSSYPDKKPRMPLTPDSQMITLSFENGATCTLRTSGTEPKLKYYCELPSPTSMAEARKELSELVAAIVNELVQPEKHHGLRPAPSD